MYLSMLAVLTTFEIVVIAVVSAVFAGVIAAALIYKRRKKRSVDETEMESFDEVNENARAVLLLKPLAKGDAELCAALDGLHAALLSLPPSAEEEAAVADEKIKCAIVRLKSALSGAGKGDAARCIEDIYGVMEERSAIVNS